MKRGSGVAVGGLALLLAGGGAEGGETWRTGRFENWSCRGILVSATPGAAERKDRESGRRHHRFSAAEILDLEFDVVLARRVAPGSVLSLELYTPNGHLYQSFDVPVAEPESDERVRLLKGYPFALGVAKSRREAEPGQPGRSGGPPRWLRLLRAPPFPVAGTPIVTNSLYGSWRVEARLSESRRPCRAEFEIVR